MSNSLNKTDLSLLTRNSVGINQRKLQGLATKLFKAKKSLIKKSRNK